MAIDLRKAIEKKYEGPQTYQNLLKILVSSSGDISFWGARCVSASGYCGWVHVDDLIKRVARIVLGVIQYPLYRVRTCKGEDIQWYDMGSIELRSVVVCQRDREGQGATR